MADLDYQLNDARQRARNVLALSEWDPRAWERRVGEGRGIEPVQSEFEKAGQTALASPALSFADATLLLQAIDVRARQAVDRVAAEAPFGTPFGSGAAIAWGRELARWSRLANELRSRRRTIAHEIVRHGGGDPAAWMRRVCDDLLEPLLWRPWLPWLLYEPNGDGHCRRLAWPEPGITPDLITPLDPTHARLAIAQIANAGREASEVDAGDWLVETMWNWAANSPPGGAGLGWAAAAAYLRAALAQERARQRPPYAASVLLAPAHPDRWLLGHLVDVLIVPASAADHIAADLREKSWLPAYAALGKANFLRALDVSSGDALAVGDYPGGARALEKVDGASAGLALAAMVAGVACSLEQLPNRVVSAAIQADGGLVPVGDSRGSLAAKARIAALSGAERFLVAANENLSSVNAALEPLGIDGTSWFSTWGSLEAVVHGGQLLHDPYLAEHQRLGNRQIADEALGFTVE